jgi:hypothetical protein
MTELCLSCVCLEVDHLGLFFPTKASEIQVLSLCHFSSLQGNLHLHRSKVVAEVPAIKISF